MNYLAHIFLGGSDPEIQLGNFIADGLRRSEYEALPIGIQQGVMHHRKLDQFNDRHPAFRETVGQMKIRHKKYAPVVMDILNDHLLCLNWDLFSADAFNEFERTVYQSFDKLRHQLPDRPALRTSILVKHRYLKAYGTQEGLRDVLRRMDNRARFQSNFKTGVEDLYENLDFYNERFIELFNDLRTVYP